MRFLLPLLLFTLAIPLNAGAQTKTQPNPPETLEKLVDRGAQIYYLGEYENMHGWVLIRQGKPEYFYENEDRTAMTLGLLFDDEGNMVTMSQLANLKSRIGDEMYSMTRQLEMPESEVTAEQALTETSQTAPQPQAQSDQTDNAENQSSQQQTPTATNTTTAQTSSNTSGPAATPITNTNRQPTAAEMMYADLITANWITMNPNGNHDVFAFIDPDCKHCQDFIRASDEFLEKGQIRLRVLPVGMNDESARRAAFLLASGNPAERLKNYVDGNTDALPVNATINTNAVQSNVQLMIKNNFDVTPSFVYRTEGGKIRIIRGRPQDTNNIIRDIREN